jgi:hypothetical protein
MASTRTWLRVVGLVTLAAASLLTGLLMLCAASLEAEQWLLRWRAQRLMAEMHQIRLYQSTWANAQRLMHEWGAWGHSNGTCTAQDCHYEIELGDHLWIYSHGEPSWWQYSLLLPKLVGILNLRAASIGASFTVHNGTIWRTSSTVYVDVSPGPWRYLVSNRFEAGDYGLIIRAHSRERLHRSKDIGWLLGSDDQLAEHPMYKAGRPSGCTNCLAAEVTYSTHTPQDEIIRLTTYDFSCLTRWHPCERLEELLPAESPWHLYEAFLGPTYHPTLIPPPAPRECDIPLWALGRDFDTVVAVEVLKIGKSKQILDSLQTVREQDLVHVRESLKGDPDFVGMTIEAQPSDGEEQSLFVDFPRELSEHMTTGRRYLLLFDNHAKEPPSRYLPLERCGVQPDTPETRRKLQAGFAMNDELRGADR